MIIKTLLLLAIYSITLTLVSAQTFSINWSNSLGGFSNEEGYSICQAIDSTYLVAGFHQSIDGDITEWYGGSDIWLVNLSNEGIINWQQTIGGSQFEEALCVIPTTDSGFVISGFSNSANGDIEMNFGLDDCLIFKLDSLGNMVWQVNIGGSNSERATSIIRSFDGNYLFTGYSKSNDGPFLGHIGDTEYSDLIIGKIDNEGSLLWVKNFGGSFSEEGYQIIETLDSNYIAIGKIEVEESEFDYFLVKVSIEGDLISTKSYGGSASDAAQTIVEFEKNKFWISGSSYSNDGDILGSHGSGEAWTVVVDSLGETLWSRSYGGSNVDTWYDGYRIDENSIAFCGTTSSEDGDVIGYEGLPSFPDYWIIVLDSIGEIKWQGCFGGSGTDQCYAFNYTFDNSFILTGTTFSPDGDVIGYHDDGGLDYPKDAWTLEVSLSCEPTPYYQDFDGDAFGDASNYIYSCNDTIGYVLDNTDCDDLNNLISPAALEVCNTIDDNCDGEIDEDFIYVQQYADMDGDDFGNPLIDTIACPNLLGFVVDSTDCNDSDPEIYPGAIEVLNGLDDDCDQVEDEGLNVLDYSNISVTVYPNPAYDNVIIEYSDLQNPELTIYNITGELLILINKITTPQSINILSYPSGIYFFELSNENKSITGFFIKD